MADLSLIPETEWREAQRRAELVRPLAARERRPRHLVRAAAATLGLSERQTYTLLRRCRDAGGELTALLPGRSSGGRGTLRLPAASEATLRRIVEESYLTPQRRSAARVVEEVIGRCRQEGLRPPSPSTVRRRLKTLPLADLRRRGGEHPEATPVHGHAPPVRYPLDLMQVDHTPVDLILVDPLDREPTGRPWLTVASDVHSRCVVGFHVTLEAPSATSVGLCLAHAAVDKAPWLGLRGVEADWSVAGKPRRVGVDNAAEFHSAAFERGCAQHGIAVDWRPPGRPHFGGVVERVIGTLMGLVHGLPGTTFSSAGQRGSYDSDKAACLTLDELERWLAVAVTKYYHLRPHEGLDGQAPLRRWRDGVAALAAEGGAIPLPRDLRAYLVDFLPVLRRSLQRDGIRIDHLTYFSPALRAWIAARDRPDPLLIRRDPRDLSRVFVLDPREGGYLEVPTRDLSRPSISLWEHRLARRRLRARHRGEVDEAALYAAVEEMRAAERTAQRLTRSARRDRARRATAPGLPAAPPSGEHAATIPVTADTEGVPESVLEAETPRPFDNGRAPRCACCARSAAACWCSTSCTTCWPHPRNASASCSTCCVISATSCASRSPAWARARPISPSAATTSSRTASSRSCCRPGRTARSSAACSPASRPCCRCANPPASAHPHCAQVLRRSKGTIGEVAALLVAAAETALLAGEERIGAAALERADYQPPSVRRRLFERELR